MLEDHAGVNSTNGPPDRRSGNERRSSRRRSSFFAWIGERAFRKRSPSRNPAQSQIKYVDATGEPAVGVLTLALAGNVDEARNGKSDRARALSDE